jgi:hypothetical protein
LDAEMGVFTLVMAVLIFVATMPALLPSKFPTADREMVAAFKRYVIPTVVVIATLLAYGLAAIIFG